MQGFDIIFFIVVLILSVIIHEVSHGYIANILGDPTAKLQGRLTLNPIRHIDLFGSIILPLLLIIMNAGFLFGWAKPVPYNPYNLRAGKWGPAIVAGAGPASNLLIAIIFALFISVGSSFGLVSAATIPFLEVIVSINVVLGIFNLIPIPPLDGSKVLFALLPYKLENVKNIMERYSLILLFLLVFVGWDLIVPVLNFVLNILL